MNIQTSHIQPTPQPPTNWNTIFLQVFYVVLISCFFLVSVDMLVSSFRLFGKNTAEQIFPVANNPFVGLFVGMLVTAMLQSSSTVTAMVVAAVAANTITLQTATPIIIGANIGTTITSAVVAMGHIAKKKQLRKAFAAASLHDFFNVLTALVLFPLEYYFHFLSNLAQLIERLFSFPPQTGSFIPPIISIPTNFVMSHLVDSSVLMLLLSLASVFFATRLFIRLLQNTLIGKRRQQLHSLFFGSSIQSFGSGFLLTAIIHSSSVTTSLVVPLVATRKVNIYTAFPFIVGANIGTTLTTLLAALFKSHAAISIAFVHILFNLIGALLFLCTPFLREIPMMLSQRLGVAAMRNRMTALLYLVVMFFILPFGIIYSSFQFQEPTIEYTSTKLDLKKNDSLQLESKKK